MVRDSTAGRLGLDWALAAREHEVVVEAPGAGATLDELETWFESKGLATFKWPERLETVDALPRSARGKVTKAALREDLEERLHEEGQLD